MRNFPIAVMLTAFLVAPAMADKERSAQTPYGKVSLYVSYRPNCPAIRMLPGGKGFKEICEKQVTRSWFVFAGHYNSSFVWPKGQTIAITCKDGRMFEAVDIICMTPREAYPGADAIHLDGRPFDLTIPCDRVFRKLIRDGSVSVQLYVSFSDPNLGMGDIAGVQVRQRFTISTAAQALKQ